MRTTIFSFFLLIFFTFTIYSGSGLKCWSCDSENNSKCGDPFHYEDYHLVDCNQHASTSPNLTPVCKKTKEEKQDGTYHIRRSCDWEHGPRSSLCTEIPPHMNLKFCGSCRIDGCNGSTNISSSISFIIFSLFTTILCLYSIN